MMNYELFRVRTMAFRAHAAANVPVTSELSTVDLGLMVVF